MSLEQYNNVCKDEFKELKDALHSIDKRLFIDNGTKSIQTILNEHSNWQKNHDILQSTKSNAFTFPEWIKFNWRTISAIIFIVGWIISQLFSGNNFSTEQKSEIKEMFKTIIVDTRGQ